MNFIVRNFSLLNNDSCESAIYFNLTTDIIKIIVILTSILIKQILPQPCWMEVMKWF